MKRKSSRSNASVHPATFLKSKIDYFDQRWFSPYPNIPGRTHQAGHASWRGRETDRRANDRRRWDKRSSRTPALFGDLRTL